jgi:tetratricopeptide (TPR) repeat protein
MIGFLAYGAFAIRLLFRSNWQGLVGLALLYPWLQYFVEFSTIRVQEIFVLYRSYLWMPGFMLLIPLFLLKLPGRKSIFALGFILILFVPLSWNRLWVFADAYRIWNDAAKLLHNDQQPGADRIIHNRGIASVAAKHWQAAADDFEKVATLDPLIPMLRHDIAIMYFNLGRYQEAIVQIDKALELDPDYAKAYYDKGMFLKWLKQDDEAMKMIVKSCSLHYGMACVIVKVSQIQR